MNRYVVLDAHCDTLAEMWKKGDGLERSGYHVNLTAASELAGYGQFFAICPLPGVDTGYTCEAFYDRFCHYKNSRRCSLLFRGRDSDHSETTVCAKSIIPIRHTVRLLAL